MDKSDATVCRRVVERVAAATNSDPTELPPLHDVIDAEALNALFVSASPTVRFEYAGCAVTVRSPTDVQVRPLGTDRTATRG
ncbi:MAG: HalOD1 output domain-containing protein [Halobaculum sp.]